MTISYNRQDYLKEALLELINHVIDTHLPEYIEDFKKENQLTEDENNFIDEKITQIESAGV